MPPALSDEEASDLDVGYPLPVQTKQSEKRADGSASYTDDEVDNEPAVETNGDAGENGEEEEEEEEGEDEELDEDEFVVEKILDHIIDADGTLKFRVKWEGYEKKADQTWEPEDTLREGASEVLEEYLVKVGGRDRIFQDTETALKTKKRGRPSAGGSESNKRSKRNGHPSESSPPASAKSAPGAWQPPAGSWEDHIESIDACEDEKTQKLIVFLNWKNGRKTKHSTEVIYRRCPQKMLRFYENHVRIVKHETAGGIDSAEMQAAVAESEAVSKMEES